MSGPYFRGPDGTKHYYTGIAEAIKYVAPHARGHRIFEQLEELDLFDDFMKGATPYGLPYSFSDYELEILDEH